MIRFEQHKHNPCYREVNKDFLDAIITEPKLDEFPYINPSLILMLCYGLIVYTREYWERTSNVSYDLLAKRICDESK